jgi:hypothetical protein
MKSAYELAMERLEKAAPSTPLTDSQKAQIADLNSLTQSRLAEKEVFLGDLLSKARAAGNFSEVAELEQQLSREIRRIKEEAEVKKEAIREGRS